MKVKLNKTIVLSAYEDAFDLDCDRSIPFRVESVVLEKGAVLEGAGQPDGVWVYVAEYGFAKLRLDDVEVM